MSITADARDFALDRHGTQRYGVGPYSDHLAAVVRVLADFGFIGPMWAACGWLHDTLEDTETSREELAAEFGEDVASIVFAVSGFGACRAGRQADILAKVCRDRRAAILKAADRIANIEAGARDAWPGRHIYVAEAPAFRKAVEHFLPTAMLNRLGDAVARIA